MIFTVSVVNLSGKAGSTNSEMAEFNEATPIYGGTLRLVGGAPSTFNPLLNFWQGYDSHGIFNTLLTYDENCSLQPELAEDYEASEDGLNVTFHLYENVSWHDGTEFNASDVKFTFDTILYDPNVDSIWKEGYVYGINSTEVINASTIIFHLNQPFAALPEYLSYVPIIPRHIYEGTDLRTNPANANPIGTGPFKFENRTSEPRTMTVTANEQYFRGRPYLDKIVYKAGLQGSASTAALENNVVDVVPAGVDPSRILDLQNTTGTSVETREAAEYYGIVLNVSHPILQSRSVREAIAHAINKTKIVTEAYYGYALVAKGPLPPSLQEWYNPNVIDYQLNKTLAEELLDQEYPRGPDGWRFSLLINTPLVSHPWRAVSANIIEDDLRSIGINATVEFGMSLDDSISGNFSDAIFLGYGFDALGPDDLYMFHSSETGMFRSYSNATLDALLEEGRSSFNETLRKIDFDRAQEIIAEDLPQVFLYHPYAAVAHSNDFHGRFLSTPPVNERLASYFLKEIWYDPTLSGKGNCPYRVCFTDSEGRRTGYYDGIVYEDIPDSTYSGMDSDPQLVKIREPAGIYAVELVGSENASYKFEFVNMALDYKNVRIPEGFIHENETITYIVKVFQDGSMKVYDYDKYSEHDLGILNMKTSKTLLGQHGSADLNVSVFNWGNFTEYFNVTVYANATIIETREVALTGGDSMSLTFSWNLSGIDYGKYTISSYSWPVSGEIDTSDNNFTLGVLKVTIWGDINGDFTVDIYDAIILANAYNSKPGSPNWNPNADLKADEVIDIYDAIILANHYNQHYP
jgi:peptide/nickel transport system substrate-binding protein